MLSSYALRLVNDKHIFLSFFLVLVTERLKPMA